MIFSVECLHLANFRAEILPSMGEILCRKMASKNSIIVSAPVLTCTAHFILHLLQVIDLGNLVRSAKSAYHDVPSWHAFVFVGSYSVECTEFHVLYGDAEQGGG